MAEPSGRQQFRFRLPWMINPISNLTRPSAEPQRATQPTAMVPVQRTIRAPTAPLPLPPGPPPPPPPPLPKTQPMPSSPPRSDPKSGVASQPQAPFQTQASSPSRTTPQSQTTSQPPSPSRTAPLVQVASLPPSPSRTTPSQPHSPPRAESQPTSPSRTTPSQSQASPRMEAKPAPLSPAAPRTTPQPPSPTQANTSQSQAPPPRTETKPTPSSPAAPQTAPQSQATSQPPSPTRADTSQSQAPPRTETKPTPPSPVAPQSRMSSQSPSPSRIASKTQSATRTGSQPPSPSPTNTQRMPASRVPSKPSSPARLASQQTSRASPQSPSSSRTTPAPQTSTIQKPSQPSSPSRQILVSPTKTQASSLPPSPPKSSASNPEPSSNKTAKTVPTISHPLSQDPQTQVPDPQSQNQIQSQVTSDQVEGKKQPSPILSPAAVSMSTSIVAPPEIPATQPLKSFAGPIDPNKHQNLEAETKESKEEKPKLESSRKEDKPTTVVNEEPKQRKSTDFFNMVAGSNNQPQGWSGTTSQGQHNHLKKQTAPGANKDMARESKITTTTPQKDINVSCESHPKQPVHEEERATLHKEIKEGIFGLVHKLGAGHTTESLDGPVSVITLTGENRGASMHVGAELVRKEGSVHIHRGYKLNQDDKNEVTTDGESSSKRTKSSKPITKEDEASIAYINSNVQSINNSIMSSSSISERSPGVRWVLEHNQIEPVKNGNKKSVEAHKADFNVTHSQKLTYEPTVRRRCLRGLFLEPNASDPDNPEKPRCHGCRYICDEKKKCMDNGKEGSTI